MGGLGGQGRWREGLQRKHNILHSNDLSEYTHRYNHTGLSPQPPTIHIVHLSCFSYPSQACRPIAVSRSSRIRRRLRRLLQTVVRHAGGPLPPPWLPVRPPQLLLHTNAAGMGYVGHKIRSVLNGCVPRLGRTQNATPEEQHVSAPASELSITVQ
jgi:hypothetical protein